MNFYCDDCCCLLPCKLSELLNISFGPENYCHWFDLNWWPELFFFRRYHRIGALNLARWTGTPFIEFIVCFPLSKFQPNALLFRRNQKRFQSHVGLVRIFNQKFMKTIELTICTYFFNLQEGSIGHDVVIKPVPAGIINADADSSSSSSGAHHIVFKRKADPMDQLSDFGKLFILL